MIVYKTYEATIKINQFAPMIAMGKKMDKQKKEKLDALRRMLISLYEENAAEAMERENPSVSEKWERTILLAVSGL